MKKAMTIVILTILVVTFSMATAQKAEELGWPCLKGNIDAVKKLIKAGVDVNKKFSFGKIRNATALIIAVRGGYADIGKLLIDAGANVNVTADGLTLLHIATLCINENKAKAVTELLIAKGLDVNAKATGESNRENDGSTPLHGAAGKGHVTVAEVLIKNGAKVNARSQYSGSTPLDVAIRKGHKEMTDLLRKHGGKQAREIK